MIFYFRHPCSSTSLKYRFPSFPSSSSSCVLEFLADDHLSSSFSSIFAAAVFVRPSSFDRHAPIFSFSFPLKLRLLSHRVIQSASSNFNLIGLNIVFPLAYLFLYHIRLIKNAILKDCLEVTFRPPCNTHVSLVNSAFSPPPLVPDSSSFKTPK